MTPAFVVALATGSSLGLASSAHCAVMCGPLALASKVRGGVQATLAYFVGRFVSYTVLGALAGSVGRALLLSPFARWAEALLSWLFAATLVYAAFSALRAGQQRAAGGEREAALVQLGNAPRANVVGRMLAHVADDPLLLGAATALLPCGALLSALTAAATLGSALAGGLSMASFATVSGVAVVGVAQLGRTGVRSLLGRRLMAGALLIGAAIMFYRPLPGLREGAPPACCTAVTSSEKAL